MIFEIRGLDRNKTKSCYFLPLYTRRFKTKKHFNCKVSHEENMDVAQTWIKHALLTVIMEKKNTLHFTVWSTRFFLVINIVALGFHYTFIYSQLLLSARRRSHIANLSLNLPSKICSYVRFFSCFCNHNCDK